MFILIIVGVVMWQEMPSMTIEYPLPDMNPVRRYSQSYTFESNPDVAVRNTYKDCWDAGILLYREYGVSFYCKHEREEYP